MKKQIIIAIFALMSAQTTVAQDKIPVYVSIVPQRYFVQQIGKDLVDVHVMVSPGASPAIYEPKPRQMADISTAKAYFSIGVPFEGRWLSKIASSNPAMKVVATDREVQKIPMAVGYHLDEPVDGEHPDGREHGEDDHGHGGMDPHIWLSPPLVKIQARHILHGLEEIDPAHGSRYEQNYRAFIRKIDSLDEALNRKFAKWKDRRFIVFHPSWGYFAQAYNLKMTAIEVQGKDPKPAQLQSLIKHARHKGIKVVFVQPQFSMRSAKLIAREIGGKVAFADPLAENWADNLLGVADQFKAALK
ncbi:MAG: zinc ABC transporter substrate-binding protein [Desulfobacteraceae bacterium]